jgi:hypothetical protein
LGHGGDATAGSTERGGSTADPVAGGGDSTGGVVGGGATGCGALGVERATGATGRCGAAASPRHAAQVATLQIANQRQADEASIALE